MKSVVIISKPDKPELQQLVPDIVAWFEQHEYTVTMDNESAAYAPGRAAVERASIGDQGANLALVLGGDGTLLSAARAVAASQIPILGVNLGSLGFLTEVPLSELYETLQAVDEGRCAAEKRSMIYCRLMRGEGEVAEFHALNDAVINKSAIARLVSFDLYLDQVFVSNYKADGVIVSSPTGSTAYSLAAGGPILMPSVDAFVINPVCPHSLTHRPLVVRDTIEISVVAVSLKKKAFLTIDGQVGVPLEDGDRVLCRKSKYGCTLLRMRKTFFDVLRTKLKLGMR